MDRIKDQELRLSGLDPMEFFDSLLHFSQMQLRYDEERLERQNQAFFSPFFLYPDHPVNPVQNPYPVNAYP